MPEWLVMDGPEDTCFGCGQRNDLGLRLRFQLFEDGSVEAEYVTPKHFAGAPGVVHGGIQAAMLDEVQGIALHSALGPQARIATADFRLRYRRPVPDEQPLVLRGRIVRSEDPSYFTEGEIVGADGEVLTRAEARWRRLD
ncbi:MAG: PaaI family thioesterase [Actinomycetota bacterium]